MGGTNLALTLIIISILTSGWEACLSVGPCGEEKLGGWLGKAGLSSRSVEPMVTGSAGRAGCPGGPCQCTVTRQVAARGLPPRAEGTGRPPGLVEARPNTYPLASPYSDLFKHPHLEMPSCPGIWAA